METQEFDDFRRQEAHRKLVDDVIIVLGLLGPTDDYETMLRFLPEDSWTTFLDELFEFSSRSPGHTEMPDQYLLSAMQVDSPINAVSLSGAKFTLNASGEYRLAKIMEEHTVIPDSRPYIDKIKQDIIASEISKSD